MIQDVIVKEDGEKGKGVFSLREFSKGEFIFRRRYGRIIQNEAVFSLSVEDQMHLCELDWERSAVLLPPGCYMNHSCDPNAMRKGTIIFAWRDIHLGEEITIDYRLYAFTNERCDCYCASENYPGYYYLSNFSLCPDRQVTYLPYAPKFIQAEYRLRKSL